MINLFLSKLAYKADNWAGDGKKILGYTFLAFCFLFPVVPLMASMGAWGLLLIPYTFFCALAYRKWGAWGELFVHDNDTLDPKHKWFYRLIDKVYGYKYVTLITEEKKQWKIVGWGLRYAIYCLPISALYAYANFASGDFLNILTPFIMMPLAGILRGVIYWYGLTHKDLKWCEQWGGAAAMFLIVSSGL
jgi:hypothetical protein